MGYSYKVPDEGKLLEALIDYHTKNGNKEVAELLKGGKCVFSKTSTYSDEANVFYAEIYIYVDADKISKLEDYSEELLAASLKVVPKDRGFKVNKVEILAKSDL